MTNRENIFFPDYHGPNGSSKPKIIELFDIDFLCRDDTLRGFVCALRPKLSSSKMQETQLFCQNSVIKLQKPLTIFTRIFLKISTHSLNYLKIKLISQHLIKTGKLPVKFDQNSV